MPLSGSFNVTAARCASASGSGNGSSGGSSIQVPLPVLWSMLPAQAELQLSVTLQPVGNAAVAQAPARSVALFVFGTPLGHCPPGELALSLSPQSFER